VKKDEQVREQAKPDCELPSIKGSDRLAEMNKRHLISRRGFLASASPAIAVAMQAQTPEKEKGTTIDEPVIDVHQHTNYLFRSDKRLVAHQRAMGVTTTLLLPAGSTVNRPSTHEGKSNGLAAKTGGNETVMALAKKHPKDFRFGVNEVPDLPNARKELEKYLKAGAVIIGEQKFNVACDSPHVWGVAEVAREYEVPVLMHFQHNAYNLGIERFHRTLEKFPEVNFIGHAQTWWGNVDKNHKQAIMYPKTKVNSGGISDKLLSNYPNMYGDFSAGSGLNSMLRDEEHAKDFIARHPNQLLYGSDCPDAAGRGVGCKGSVILATIRRLAQDKKVERKILHGNSKKLFKL
jgi:predicted TIM-barrel fold metal-dependent hydrolase